VQLWLVGYGGRNFEDVVGETDRLGCREPIVCTRVGTVQAEVRGGYLPSSLPLFLPPSHTYPMDGPDRTGREGYTHTTRGTGGISGHGHPP